MARFRLLTEQMMRRKNATILASAQAEQKRRELQTTDPFEQAKTYLQKQGYSVFAHALLEPGSKLIVVGRKTMSRAEVIAYAAAMRGRKAQ